MRKIILSYLQQGIWEGTGKILKKAKKQGYKKTFNQLSKWV